MLRGGERVPVLYAGADLTCALGETVFHDLHDDPTVVQEVFAADLLALRAGTLHSVRELRLADLTDPALNAYGVSREGVIATPPEDYPVTATWGQAAYDRGVDGLVWNSRRSPARQSYLLFVDAPHRGLDRRRDLEVSAAPVPLADGPGLGAVMTAATDRNVTIIVS